METLQEYKCSTCRRVFLWCNLQQGFIESICDCGTPLKHFKPITGSIKHDQGKADLSILSVHGLSQIALALQFGAKKYNRYNYLETGFKYTRLSSAALRHLYAWVWGEDKDAESGLSHLAHAGACIVMLIDHGAHNIGEDDRFKKGGKNE
jgi:hypothetical protein